MLSTPISLEFWLLTAVILILCGLRWYSNIRNYIIEKINILKFTTSLPGPLALPILGNAVDLWESEKVPFTLAKIGQQLNASVYRIWLGPSVKVVITNPDDIEIVVKSAIGADKDDIWQFVRPTVVNGLFNSPYDATYKYHKKLIAAGLSTTSQLNMFLKGFNTHSRKLVQCLEKNVDKGEFDVYDDIKWCVADIVFDTLLGFPPTAQSGNPSRFIFYAERMLHFLHHRIMRPWLYPDFIYRLTSQGRLWQEMSDDCHALVDDRLVKTAEEFQSNPTFGSNPSCAMNFVYDQFMQKVPWKNEEIKSEAMTVYIGALDTTLGMCCFNLLMLAMHPEVQTKVREEIKNCVKNEYITLDEASNLKYLEMVIRETVRLFPVAPILPRKTSGDLKLTTCTIPKGCSVLMLAYVTQRDPKYWVEPEKFVPERFSPENSKNRHPYAYLGWSAGLRGCPGPKYSVLAMKVMIAYILRSYELTTPLTLDTLRVYADISTRSQDGYPIAIKKISV